MAPSERESAAIPAGRRSSQAGFADAEPRGRLTALQLVQTGSAEQTRPPCETSSSLLPFTVAPPARRRRSASFPFHSLGTYMNVHRPLSPPGDARAGTVPPACQGALRPHGGRTPRFSLVLLMGRACPSHGHVQACMFTCTINKFICPATELFLLFFFLFLLDRQPCTGKRLSTTILGFFPSLFFFRCNTKTNLQLQPYPAQLCLSVPYPG